MKNKFFALILAVLAGNFSTANAQTDTNQWDFEYAISHADSSNASDYVVEQENIQRYYEGFSASYLCPIVNGSEARLTQRFNFPRLTKEIFLHAELSTYNFGSIEYGNGSLWGSTNGTNWLLLMDAPTPTGIDAYYSYATNLPSALVGNKEIWIQTRLMTSGWNIMAQFLRAGSTDTYKVFELKAQLAPNPGLSIETAAVRLRWLAESNVTYQVQWSKDMLSWSNLTSIVGTGSETNLIEWTEGPKKYYRLMKP